MRRVGHVEAARHQADVVTRGEATCTAQIGLDDIDRSLFQELPELQPAARVRASFEQLY